ncbi:3523_t:CDS:2 [Cetraspora pellucida]|uniref:3523_t:CDS:1 n=1 Tax=Cetraspora pellucida TaxID=1433469 RepID=A0A9N9DL60_9GLOM|nr:3523_t:CDS:2 [Cetraspora pellucida]
MIEKEVLEILKDLVLFLKTSLDLNNEIFIDNLENFSDEDNDKDLLLETDEIVENIKE